MRKLLFAVAAFAGIHTQAQRTYFYEDFNAFTTGTTSLPQSGWNKVTTGPFVYIDGTGGQNYVQSYAFMYPNTASYLISPVIAAPQVGSRITFLAGQTTGSAGAGTVEVGLVTNPTDMSTFTSLGAAIPLSSSNQNVYEIWVAAPQTQQYIAFKFIGNVPHAALLVDDIKYELLVAAVSESHTQNLKIALNADKTAVVFQSSNKNLNRAVIYSASGQKVSEGTIINNSYSILGLKPGIYMITVFDNTGKAETGKFIVR